MSIENCVQKQQYILKDPWQNRLALILDEISMVFLRLLEIIDICLSQAKGKTNNDVAILGGLALTIVMGDFYQFFPVTRQFLYTNLVTKKKIHDKSIWN